MRVFSPRRLLSQTQVSQHNPVSRQAIAQDDGRFDAIIDTPERSR